MKTRGRAMKARMADLLEEDRKRRAQRGHARLIPGGPAPLPEKELVLAAKFFTVLNLGGEVPKAPRTVAQIERAFAKCKQDHGYENIDITDEYNDWVATFRKRDAYAMTTWAKDAETITDVASVRVQP